MAMTKTQDALYRLAAINIAKFMENAEPATSRQINFLAAIIDYNNIPLADIEADVEHYNGGFAWGLDKEGASMLIAHYATPADMERRERAKQRTEVNRMRAQY